MSDFRDPAPKDPLVASLGNPESQPLTIAEEAAPPAVPTHETQTLAHARKSKLWTAGTLVYTTAGLLALFFWLLFGDFAVAMRERSVGPVIQLMLKGWGTTNLTMSVLMTVVPTAIAMVMGPIVSYKSDRLRSRWGRRIPFLLIPTPIAALAMIGMAFTPHLATWLQEFSNNWFSRQAALLTVFSVFWTAFDFAVVISGSVLGGLINDVVPRPVLGRFYALFRAVTLIDGMIFNWFILGHAEEHFTAIFVWIALVFGIGFSLMCFMVKEGDYPAPASAATDHRSGGFFAAVGIYFRECFSKSHYRWIFAAFTLALLAANPINMWAVPYAKKIELGMGNWSPVGIGFGEWRLGYGGIMTLTYTCSLLMAYPLGALVDRFNTLRVAIVAMAVYATSCLVGGLLVHDTQSFGWALLAHGVLSGTYFTAAASMGQALLPKTKFSQFASAGALVNHLVMLGFAPLLGKVLDLTGSNYRLTFFLSAAFSFSAIGLLCKVYRQYMALGGPGGYVAPLSDGEAPAGGFPVVQKSH